MKKKIVWLALSCLMVAALLLASCAPATTEEEAVKPKEEVKKEEVVKEEVKKEEVVKEEVKVTAAAEEPTYGGVFSSAGSNPNGFDDCLIMPWGASTLEYTHDELLIGDWTKGPAGTGEASWQTPAFFPFLSAGSLAESWEAPDPSTIIFHIRKGVHWQDKPPVNGRELTADDVVFNINRRWRINTSYAFMAYPPAPKEVTATDKYTVVVKLQPGDSGALKLRVIGDAYFSIYPPEIEQKYGNYADWKNSIGTGPFMLADYVRDSSVTYVRNPNYWGTDPFHPQNQLPYLDGVKVVIIPDLSTQVAALRTGKIDTLGSLTREDAISLQKTNPELKWVMVPPSTPRGLHMRSDVKPLDDVRVRRALQMTIDRQAIANDFYGGDAQILATVVADFPEYSSLYTPLEKMPESVQEVFTYNPTKAKALLAEAGYPNGFKTSVDAQASDVDVLAIYAGYFASIGVTLEIKVSEVGAYTSIGSRKSFKDMYYGFYYATGPEIWLHWQPNGASNWSIINDKRINDAIAASLAAGFDFAKRDQTIKDVIPYIIDQAWVIQTPAPYTWKFWQPWVKGYLGEQGPGTVNNKFHKYIWLDLDLKEEMTGRR